MKIKKKKLSLYLFNEFKITIEEKNARLKFFFDELYFLINSSS